MFSTFFFFGFNQQLVQPYLQNLSSNEVTIVWESVSCNSGELQWGHNSLSNSVSSSSIIALNNSCIHNVKIQNLLPNTQYSYKAINDSYSSQIFSFQTPHLNSSEETTRLIAISDMQKDQNHPDVFEKIINDGIIGHIENNFNGSISSNLQMVLIPGDLVHNGNNHNEWVNDFFDAGKNLFSYVPIYPILGNHENNSSFFFNYFNLPENSSVGYNEHWWYKDQSNIRIIGMDSNSDYQILTQLEWLDSILELTTIDSTIDFVFAQLHHPHHSELWPIGNSDFTGDVIQKLENFSNNSGKPSVHFFGHTHGYSRGQSKNHRHLMVNVASAGGNIDYWNEYFQEDYEEYSISQDEYGFVVVEVTAGENPYFLLKRFSLGDQYSFKTNSLEDSICIKLKPVIPITPSAKTPKNNQIVSPDGFVLEGSLFIDNDNDGHGATQWQISLDSSNFNSPLIDHWIQYQNIYKEIDINHNIDLSKHQINTLLPNETYFWRFRYRDKGLNWSNWSEVESFKTDSAFLNWNLYPNPMKENAFLHIPYAFDKKFDILIYDNNGKIVREYKSVYPPVLNIEKKDFTQGTFIVSIMENSELVKTLKLTIL